MATVSPSIRRLPTLALGTVAALCAAGFLAGLQVDDVTLRLATKPLPVLAMLAWVLLHRRDAYALLVAAGLGLSVVGDVLLEIPADLFVPGLLAFLVAHLLYIAAALNQGRRLALLWALPFLAWCVGVYVWLFPGMGALAVPVGIYVGVIGTMMWRMGARLTDTTGAARTGAVLALVGAVVFGLSDSLIAVGKFSGPFPGIRPAIIGTYWLGQLGITASVAWPRVRRGG